jgi:hypothetical protein
LARSARAKGGQHPSPLALFLTVQRPEERWCRSAWSSAVSASRLPLASPLKTAGLRVRTKTTRTTAASWAAGAETPRRSSPLLLYYATTPEVLVRFTQRLDAPARPPAMDAPPASVRRTIDLARSFRHRRGGWPARPRAEQHQQSVSAAAGRQRLDTSAWSRSTTRPSASSKPTDKRTRFSRIPIRARSSLVSS